MLTLLKQSFTCIKIPRPSIFSTYFVMLSRCFEISFNISSSMSYKLMFTNICYFAGLSCFKWEHSSILFLSTTAKCHLQKGLWPQLVIVLLAEIGRKFNFKILEYMKSHQQNYNKYNFILKNIFLN